LDVNGTGELSLTELANAMMTCGMAARAARKHAQDFFKLCDVNEGGTVSIQEFMTEYTRMQSFK
jgi:Ca2+-binding EF-hand superfamily protein